MATAVASESKVVATRMDEAREILDSRGIEWEFGTVKLADVDLARSLMWNAREDGTGLNDYWVETYALAYKNKNELPPIIVMKAGVTSKKLLVLSGHHRVAAAVKAGLTTLPAFTTPPLSDATRLYVTNEGNRTVGYGLSEAQRLESALRFVKLGETAAAAARMVGIEERKVTALQAQMRADDRLQKLTSKWNQIPAGARARLGAIQSDELLKKAADLTLAAHLAGAEVSNLVRDINKGRTDTQREDIIATQWEIYRTRVETGGKNRSKTSKQRGFIGVARASISRLANPDAFLKMDEILLSSRPDFDQQLLEAKKFCDEAVKRMKIKQRAAAQRSSDNSGD